MADIEELDCAFLPLGSSPLHVVAKSGDIKSLKLLLRSRSSKSQIDVLDYRGRTPLAVALQDGRFDAAQVLIESGASLEVNFDHVRKNTISQALSTVAYFSPFLETLIRNDAVYVKVVPDTLLHSAAYDGRCTFLRKLLDCYNVDVNSLDNLGHTALHYASRRNMFDCVEILLLSGANALLANPQGFTALHLACVGGHFSVVTRLLRYFIIDVDKLVNAQDTQGRTALHLVLYYKKLKLFDYFISNFRSRLNLTLHDNLGYTVPALLFVLKFDSRFPTEYRQITPILSSEEATWLLFEGVAQNNLELVLHSINNGASVECVDHMQHTPLLLASKVSGHDIFKTLIDAGADPNSCDSGGKNALQYACELGHIDNAIYLISLEQFDLILFFNIYNGPLTTEILSSLTDHMATHSSQRPKDWRKWLTIAVRNKCISTKIFERLVSIICPENWVEKLVGQEACYNSDRINSSLSKNPQPWILPTLIDGENKDEVVFQVYRKLRSKRIDHKKCKLLAKKIGGPFNCMKQKMPAKIFTSYAQKKSSCCSMAKIYQSRPFQFHFKGNSVSNFYPVHEAARHGNSNVLGSILLKVKKKSELLLKQLIEAKDNCGQTLAEIICQRYGRFREIVAKLNIGEIVLNTVQDIWPLNFSYSQSLQHYIVSGTTLHAVGQKSSVTPLDRWPQWMFDYILQTNGYCQEEVAMASLGENKHILQQFLKRGIEFVDIKENKKYPPLLFAAVRSNNDVAVKALLEHGAIPTVKFHGRYAITTAAINCNTIILNHFLSTGRESFASYIPKCNEFTHDLLSGLCSLANSEFVDTVKRVITDLNLFPNSVYLWQSSRSLRLIFILIELRLHESLKLADALAFDLASFLIKSMLQSTSIEKSPYYNVQHATNIMQKIKLYSHAFCRCESSNVYLLVKLANFYNKLHSNYHQHAFHCLCGWGETELVSHFLACLDTSYHTELFRNLNHHQQSPLYHAACGGHLEIVKLLLDKGCQRYNLNENPPIKGALVYLATSMDVGYNKQLHQSKFYQLRVKSQLVASRGNSKCPPNYCYHRTYGTMQSVVAMKQLLNSLIPSTEDLQQLFSCNVHFSDIFTLIIFQNNLHILHRFLCIVSDIMINPSFLALPTSFIDEAICIIQSHQYNMHNESFMLLDNILANIASLRLPHLRVLPIAAQKGFWRLVKQTFQCLLSCPDEQTNDSSISLVLSQVMIAAARHNRCDIIAHVYNVYLYGNEIPVKCYRPLLQAFQDNSLHALTFINPQNGSECLLEALKLNDVSLVRALFSCLFSIDSSAVGNFDRLISCCYSICCLDVLHEYFMKPSTIIDNQLEDINQEFWFKVLSIQSSKGNMQLSLKAIASLSNVQLQYLSNQPEFGAVLGNCCYWGMKDVLEALPFETSQLLEPCSLSEPMSPWEIAIAVGHTGKLSQIENFPHLSQALSSTPCSSQVHICVLDDDNNVDETLAAHVTCISPLLFHGVIHKLLSSPIDCNITSCVSDFFLPFREVSVKSFIDLFDCAIKLGKCHIVKACLEHLGSYAHDLLNECFSFICHACERKNNQEILELLLKHLHCEGGLDKYLDIPQSQSPLALVVSLGSVSSARVLVRLLSNDTINDQLCRHHTLRGTTESNTLLHLAVLSKCTEMVDYILELLGQDAPRLCFDNNSNGHSPLSLAFALGLTDIICYSGLVTEASKSLLNLEKHISNLPNLQTECGWFPYLIKINTLAISTSNRNVESVETTSQSSRPSLYDFRVSCILRLLTDAVSDNRNLVISRLIFLLENFQLVQKMLVDLDPQILHILVANGYLSDVSIELPKTFLLNIITGCGREKLLLCLLKLDCILHAGLLKQAFLFGCELNKSAVVHYFLQERDTHSLFENTNILKEGLAHAVACGSIETASLILLECGIDLEYKYLPHGVELSEVVELIFTCKSYYLLLNKFYLSLTQSNCDRIPLSVAWLVHGWTDREVEFTKRRLGSGNPLNPWTIIIQSQNISHEVTLSIDWESFCECLNRTEGSSKFLCIPMFVEATVFSPSVLGQVYMYMHETPSFSQCHNMFSLYQATDLSSLILTSVLWPEKPSFSSLCKGQSILTLSFMPTNGVFLFPSQTLTDHSNLDLSNRSFVSNTDVFLPFSTSIDSNDHLIDQFFDMAHFSVVTLKKVCKNLDVSISFDDDIKMIDDVKLFTQTYETVRWILDDIFHLLKLILSNRVFLHSHKNCSDIQDESLLCLSTSRSPIRNVHIQFEFFNKYTCPSECDPSHLSISMAQYTLCMRCMLPQDNVNNAFIHTCPGYHNQLLQTLVSHFTRAQFQVEREKLVKSVNTVVTRNLKNNLKIGGFFETDFISLLYEDCTGQNIKLCDIDENCGICVSLFKKMNRFLILFSKLLQIFSCQPRLQAKIRQMFETGFKISLSDKHSTSFVRKGGMPLMIVNTQQIHGGMPRPIIMEVFESLLESVQGQKLFQRSVPSIVMSYVDYEHSNGLLYPTVNKSGNIIIQLIDYNFEIISSLPPVTCVLDVCISVPGGACIKATSSHRQNSTPASRCLIINPVSNGQYVVQWTPKKFGIYYIYILANGIPIQGSPFKTHTLNPKEVCQRQALVGDSVTFVVSHNVNFNLEKYRCPSSIPVVELYKRRCIRPALLPGGKIQTPSSPCKINDPLISLQKLPSKGIHHISMCSRYGGPRQWFHIPAGDVVIYISPNASFEQKFVDPIPTRKSLQNNFSVKQYVMNNGFTRIAITSTNTALYKIFVACSKCQSVMDVIWPDQKYSLPSLLSFTTTMTTTKKQQQANFEVLMN